MYYCSMYSREILKGILKPIILKLLSENRRMYGYEITQRVKTLSQDKILIKEGSLYPTLHALTKEGYLVTESVMVDNRTRKYYSLTPRGKEAAHPMIEEVLEFRETLKLLFGTKPASA